MREVLLIRLNGRQRQMGSGHLTALAGVLVNSAPVGLAGAVVILAPVEQVAYAVLRQRRKHPLALMILDQGAQCSQLLRERALG